MNRKLKGDYPDYREVLKLIGAGVVLTGVIMMPGLAKLLPKLEEPWSDFDISRLRQTLKRLKRRRAISIAENGDNVAIRLTRKGKEELFNYNLSQMRIRKSSKWDRKWRVVLFDVSDHKRAARDALRRKLIELDFYRLQESVFVSPYPCFEEIEFLRQNYGIADEVSFVLVDKFEDEEESFLRKFFNLDRSG
jgi:phenylacetic acid degradation operon negative regulatory protein